MINDKVKLHLKTIAILIAIGVFVWASIATKGVVLAVALSLFCLALLYGAIYVTVREAGKPEKPRKPEQPTPW